MAKRKQKRAQLAPPSLPPIRQGLVSPGRPVPPHIVRPPYMRNGGEPGRSTMNPIRNAAEIEAMRLADARAAIPDAR